MSKNLNTESCGDCDPCVGGRPDQCAISPVPIVRRWLYEVADFNDDSSYVDENGEEVDRSDAKEHIATDAESALEADRRADLWETKQAAICAKVTRRSQGISMVPPMSCPACGMTALRKVRHEFGKPGKWNHWWIEGLECPSCGLKNIPDEKSKP